MNSLKVIFLLICVLLTSCGIAPAEQVMHPINYNEPIHVHTPYDADLFWQSGNDLSAIQPNSIVAGDPMVVAIASVVDAELRKSKPGRYTYVYGAAQQAVFITSFKDNLISNKVFNKLNLIAAKNEAKPNNVFIQLNFKTTRVTGPEENYAITLTVEMMIKAKNHKPFIRTYSVHNSPNPSIWTGPSFQVQQTEVSTKLLKQLFSGIAEWHQQR